jgi:hypothetical protein
METIMNQGGYNDPYRHSMWASGPNDEPKPWYAAVGVGVAATAAIATAMYLLGGREAPKMPGLGDLGAFGKREIGLGALWADQIQDEVLCEQVRKLSDDKVKKLLAEWKEDLNSENSVARSSASRWVPALTAELEKRGLS